MDEQTFLKQYNITDYEQPSVTADIIIFGLNRTQKQVKKIDITGLQVLLIRRGQHPFKDKWALPGGFCKPNETVYETATQELITETAIETTLYPINVYSKKQRDPRGWIISNAFYGIVDTRKTTLHAGDDAWDADWFTITEHTQKPEKDINPMQTNMKHHFVLKSQTQTLNFTILETKKYNKNSIEHSFSSVQHGLAFDHDCIFAETLLKLQETLKYDIRPIFNFFPEKFTLGEVQKAYEIITEQTTYNFRRTIAPYVNKTNETIKQTCRPSVLYTRNLNSIC